MLPGLITKKRATLGEKLDVVLGMSGVLIITIYKILRYPFAAASESQPTLGREISYTIVRKLLDRFNVAQYQWVMPGTARAYKDWIHSRAKIEGVPSEVVTELVGEEGIKIHWVGRKNAKKVLLHYHGGAFVMPLHNGPLNMVSHFRREIKRRSGVDVKLAFPEYTLAPHATYPTQYRQATLALKHILDSGISPADILISGDSAGAMLAFQILSHIIHPYPSFPLIHVPAVPFAGILAISPWVVFDSTARSFMHNTKDALSPELFSIWGRMVCDESALAEGASEAGGYWGEPLKAPPEWWHDAAKVTKHVLFTYGELEAFRDDDAAFAAKFKQGVTDSVEVKAVEEPGGLHIGPISDALFGRAPGDLTKVISGWVYERVIG